MGRRSDKPDRKEGRNKDKKFGPRFGGPRNFNKKNRKFGNNNNKEQQHDRSGPCSFHWHNWDRDEPGDRTPPPPGRQQTPPKVASGKFLVQSGDGSFYEIDKSVLKYTKAEPRIAYSMKTSDPPRSQTPPLPAAPQSQEKEPEIDAKTPEKLLEQLKDPKPQEKEKSKKKHKKELFLEKEASPFPLAKDSQTPEKLPPPKSDPLPTPPPVVTSNNRNSIKINLEELLPKAPSTPDEKDSEDSEGNKKPIYDIFGDVPEPVVEKKRSYRVHNKKLLVPKPASLQQITSLYDDEDEDDWVPTNAIRIGSNQIKPAHIKRDRKEPKKEKTPVIVMPHSPLPPTRAVQKEKEKEKEVEHEQKEEDKKPEIKLEIKSEPKLEEIPLTVKKEPPASPLPPPATPVPPVKPPEDMKPGTLDILKSIDSESTEVDDFLQQIQQQRQLIEEKLSNSATTPRKPAPFKFLIDIDSVQKEINDKLEELPEEEDYSQLPTIPLNIGFKKAAVPVRMSPVKNSSASSENTSSSDDEDSSNSSSSDEESESESSSSSDSSSTSSQSSDSEDESSSSDSSDKEEDEEKKKELENNSSPSKLFNLGVDLTLASRSPVMLKIQQKPRVIPALKSMSDDEELKNRLNKSTSSAREGHARETVEGRLEKDRKDSRLLKRDKRRDRGETGHGDRRKGRDLSYDRISSARKNSSRRPERERRDRREPRGRDLKERRRDRKMWRRSRSKSISPSPPPPPLPPPRSRDRHHDSRSRSRSHSRSLSLDREEHGRKRSPWRPPIDLWENLNVPTNSWAYNDDQYFSRAYYDESYNYFDQNQINQHCPGGGGGDPGGVVGGYNDTPHQNWPAAHQHHPHHHRVGSNGGPSSPMRDSLDDRINNVLNGSQGPPPQQNGPYYNNNQNQNNNQGAYHEYNRQSSGPSGHPPNYYNQQQQPQHHSNVPQYGPTSDHYRQSANLLSINCSDTPRQQQQHQPQHQHQNPSQAPFALQKGNVIELVPSHVDSNLSSSGYQSEDQKSSSSAQRKQVREKKRLEKKMRKKKLELELQQLLDGSPGIEIDIEGEKKPSPRREEVRKVIFSDGVLPGDGTSDSVLDSTDDSNTDLAEMTSNQLKKYRKKKRKKRSSEKSSVNKTPEATPPVVKVEEEAAAAVNGDASALDETVALPVPPPPPNDPPPNSIQPTLKREVQERPKKLLYFNTCHRERRMDFFSIFVPFSMFIRLNDPRLLQGHPMIVNRRRIPQPIYPPNMYPPPPQPFQNLPPVQISGAMPCGMQSAAPQVNPQMQQLSTPVTVPPVNTGPIRHIPTIGDN